MLNKYLPSKKFMLIILVVIGGGLIIFLIAGLSTDKITFFNQGILTAKKGDSLEDIIMRDSDKDGVADWEESLWGTDPNNPDTDGDGVRDDVEIENRRAEIQVEQGVPDDENLNETEQFAREFFATIVALNQSGELGEEDIQALSYNLGSNLASGYLVDPYTQKDMRTVANTVQNMNGYYNSLEVISDKYTSNFGSELEIVAQVLQTNEEETLSQINSIAQAYQAYGEEVKILFVPEIMASAHLSLINNSIKIGESIRNMSEILTNPVIGVGGVSQYRVYSNELIDALESLEIYFKQAGII